MRALVLGALLAVACSTSTKKAQESTMAEEARPEREIVEATALAGAALKARNEDPAAYRLVAAQNQLKGSQNPSPTRWRLTFKRRQLIPANEEGEIGAGGEIYVEVDLANKQTRVLGFGE